MALYTTSGDIVNRLKAMVKSGTFGESGPHPYVRDNNGMKPVAFQFISDVEFFRIGLHKIRTSESQLEDYETIWVVVKMPSKDLKVKQFVDVEAMFSNEAYFYTNLIPFLTENNDFRSFPKCFYAGINSDNRDDDLIVIEDVGNHGYSIVGGHFLDLDHLKLVMTDLGRFHGLSYKAKKQPSFMDKVGILKMINFDDEFDRLMLAMIQRGIIPLLGDNENNDLVLKELMNKMAHMKRVLLKLQQPEEPYATLCHGDFNKNNILFSYNERRVNSTIFVDFQMSTYSDPSTDVSHILYTCANQNQRDSHWDELLHDYWTGVLSVEPDPGFTFDDFMGNFARKSIYGYVPGSVVVPATFEDAANESIEDLLRLPLDERIAVMEEIGGDEATEALTHIVKDLVGRGFVHKFLKFLDDE